MNDGVIDNVNSKLRQGFLESQSVAKGEGCAAFSTNRKDFWDEAMAGEDCSEMMDCQATVHINLNSGTATAQSGIQEHEDVIPMVAVAPELDPSTGSLVIHASAFMHPGASCLMPANLSLDFNPMQKLNAPIAVAVNGEAL